MKNTLLALMLVSSLFVISCGADATKPGDAYKSQTTEIETGTATYYYASVTTGVVDLTSFMTVGVKVTDIVQIVTPGTGTTTRTTNNVTGTTKNADGGIYQFTTDAADTTSGNAWVTYKYSKKAALPIIEKEMTAIYNGGSGSYTITINDSNFIFNRTIISITDKNGRQLESREYVLSGNMVTIYNPTGYINGDTFTVRYAYGDITKMSEKPLTGNVTVTDASSGVGSSATVTIPLDVATYAGRSCYLKAVITDTSSSSGNPTTEPVYYNGIITSDGIIDITTLIPTTITPSQANTSGTYEIWFY